MTQAPEHFTKGNEDYMKLAEEHGMVESVVNATNKELVVMIRQAILAEIGICARLWAVDELNHRLEVLENERFN